MENALPPTPPPVHDSGNTKSLKLVIVGLLVLLPVVGVSSYYFGRQGFLSNLVANDTDKRVQPSISPTTLPSEDNQVACTMDAKICPDGSSVGRTGPNCEFSQCPADIGTA